MRDDCSIWLHPPIALCADYEESPQWRTDIGPYLYTGDFRSFPTPIPTKETDQAPETFIFKRTSRLLVFQGCFSASQTFQLNQRLQIKVGLPRKCTTIPTESSLRIYDHGIVLFNEETPTRRYSSGLPHLICSDVSDEHAAFIFRVTGGVKIFLFSHAQKKGSTFLPNVGTYTV